jgi:hypothetical protein
MLLQLVAETSQWGQHLIIIIILIIFHLDYLNELIRIYLQTNINVEICLSNILVLIKEHELTSSLINIELFIALVSVWIVYIHFKIFIGF